GSRSSLPLDLDLKLFKEAQASIKVPSTVKWSLEISCALFAWRKTPSKNSRATSACKSRSRLCAKPEGSNVAPLDRDEPAKNPVAALTLRAWTLCIHAFGRCRSPPARVREHRPRGAELGAPGGVPRSRIEVSMETSIRLDAPLRANGPFRAIRGGR